MSTNNLKILVIAIILTFLFRACTSESRKHKHRLWMSATNAPEQPMRTAKAKVVLPNRCKPFLGSHSATSV